MRALHLEICCAAVLMAGCGGREAGPAVVRLVDHFGEATLEKNGDGGSRDAPSRTEWRFDAPDSPEWSAGRDVADLDVRSGRLAGRSTGTFPIVHVERTTGLDDADVLHAVEIRARVSAGSELSAVVVGGEELDLDQLVSRADVIPWPLRTPLLPGDDIRAYSLEMSGAAFDVSTPASETRHVVVRPSDAAGATFEIESVRLVFRREHLAAIDSGVSWEGFGDVFRETIVMRSPERARFPVRLPEQAWLDLALASVDNDPITFRVEVAPESGSSEVVLERTLTTPHEWRPVAVDLGRYSGQPVTLTLGLQAGEAGQLGFWGAPAARSRGARIPRSEDVPDLSALGADPDAVPRGVVFVLADTLRRDHLDSYGYERETAPTLASFAREGVLFRDDIAQGAWTKVSAPSLLTSLYPTSLGIVELDDRVPALAQTVAEVFREAGYATWGASSVPFTGRPSNMHQGYEVLHERGSLDPPDGVSRSKTARVVVDRFLEWLEGHRDVPFFAFLHVMDAHDPYLPYASYDTLWGSVGGRSEHERLLEQVRPHIADRGAREAGLATRAELEKAGVDPEDFVRAQLDWYDGSIRALDAELRRVLERLRELGLERDTLVVFVSDHGEEFLDHGHPFHELDVYGEMVNVPLVFWWPGVVPAGLEVAATVQNVDVMPTLLELSGIAAPESIHGRSLVPLLSPSGARRWGSRPAISEWKRRRDQLEDHSIDAFSIVDQGWKLVHNVARGKDDPEYELYDHANDPLDQEDVAAQNPEIVERLAKQLADWRQWAEASALPSDEEAAQSLDAEELERLRSLGYVQ